MIKNVKLGNLYGCEIGSGSFIGPFVEITKGVIIGKNCRIQSHSFICGGVVLGDNVFIGHGVMFTNDRHPKVNNKNWILETTYIGNGSSIGSNSTILPVRIGRNVLVGAGTVITKNITDNTIIYSNYIKTEKRRKNV
jgi:acetyltransferase-like isoleucine patch superfamily enzyme